MKKEALEHLRLYLVVEVCSAYEAYKAKHPSLLQRAHDICALYAEKLDLLQKELRLPEVPEQQDLVSPNLRVANRAFRVIWLTIALYTLEASTGATGSANRARMFLQQFIDFARGHTTNDWDAAIQVTTLHYALCYACSFLELSLQVVKNQQDWVAADFVSFILTEARDPDYQLPVTVSDVFAGAVEAIEKDDALLLYGEARRGRDLPKRRQLRDAEGRLYDVLELLEADLRTEENPEPLDVADTTAQDPAEVVEQTLERERVLRALEQLPELERTILQMWNEGHTDTEIASALATTPKAITRRRQRILESLRQTLTEL